MRTWFGFWGRCVQWSFPPWGRFEAVLGAMSFLQWPLAIVLLIPLVLAVITLAPYRLWHQQRGRVEELEAERVPKFTVVSEGNRRYWEHQTTEHLMWAELKIRNTSPSQTLHNVEVRVTGYTITQKKPNTPGVYFLDHGLGDFKPSQVYWSRRDTDPERLKIDIPPGSERTSLIAFSDNPSDSPGILNDSIRQTLSLGGKLEVEVTSPDSAVWKGEFYIQCHGHYVSSLQEALDRGGTPATFEFIPWERWLETHPIEYLQAPDREGPLS